MGSILSYSLYSSIILAMLYLAYKWMMAGENQHRFNRFALWSIYVLSLTALPLTAFLMSAIQPSTPQPAMIEVGDIGVALAADDMEAAQPFFMTAILYVYFGGMLLVGLHTVWTLSRLICLISRSRIVEDGRYKVLVSSDSSIAPFSWWRFVVMSAKDWEESGCMIRTHEFRHLALHHWADLLFAQLVAIFQWYNPAAWLMREELKTVHEYQADSAVLASGIAPRDYQMLLIKKAVGARFPSLANSLNHSKLKKRITMMYKSNPSASRRLRGLAMLPAFAVALAVTDIDAVASVLSDISMSEINVNVIDEDKISENASENQNDVSQMIAIASESDISDSDNIVAVADESVSGTSAETVNSDMVEEFASRPATAVETAPAPDGDSNKTFTTVEIKPEFPDGGDKGLLEYISKNIRYPEAAMKNNIQGRVVLQFVIKADGSIGEGKVLRSKGPELDAEAIRVIKSLPKFIPGKVAGKPVNVWYTIPVSFKLTDDGKKEETSAAPGATSRTLSQTISIKNDAGEKNCTIVVNGSSVDENQIKIYINGKLYEGDLNKIKPDEIKSITIDKKSDPDGKAVMYIELNK